LSHRGLTLKLIFSELLKKATTTETVIETEKNDKIETEMETGKILTTEMKPKLENLY